MSEVKKYQPSNGTEGECFMAKWCCNCQRDKSLREGAPLEECDDEESCEIIVRTMAYKVSDPEYPEEWRYGERGPICTAFVQAGDDIPPPRCEKTVDMFGSKEPQS